MILAHKIALDPNNVVQATSFAKANLTSPRHAAPTAWIGSCRSTALDAIGYGFIGPRAGLLHGLTVWKWWPFHIPKLGGVRMREPLRKAKARLARLHARIANIRADALHKLTSDLARRFHTIGIEDLNVRGMVKNRHLARSIMDMGFFEFRRQLEYKTAMRGRQVVVAERFFASSKTCSACGHKLDALLWRLGTSLRRAS